MKIVPRLFSKEDIKCRVSWINNPVINSTMYFDLPASEEKTSTWFKTIAENKSRIDFTFTGEDGTYLAMGGFTGISGEHRYAEFYVMVNPELHRQGIGKRVCEWMYNYAFLKLHLNRIYLYTNDDNVAAYRVYEKSGFILEGTLRRHKWKNGAFQNRRLYGLLKSDWERLDWKKSNEDEFRLDTANQ